ncbi:Protein CBG00011 [Caenorhabditis briggsae]|uniref:Protein CBG00011 n=1 Tax=Caenorhabditis briggsae TaxID=6238 RepID=A8WM49_CAEBR|nr:Protein CBG00011 [Caenorhabditis briggsae]CAP21553.1 Protein CBG00011 [Caenorhabditis briggsae]
MDESDSEIKMSSDGQNEPEKTKISAKGEPIKEFSLDLDEDGIWRTGPYSNKFSVKTMKDIIENCVTSSNLTDFRLPVFSEPSVKFAKFRNEDHKLCDGLSWWKTTNGRKIRPRPRKIEYDGCSYRYYNCINPNDDAFKKFEIYPEKEEFFFVVYVSQNGRMDYDVLKSSKPNRLTEAECQLIHRSLKGRTYPPNQKPDEVSAGLCEVEEGPHNQFGAIYLDSDTLNLYMNSLPTKQTVLEYRKLLTGCEDWTSEEVNDFLSCYSPTANSGIIKHMAGQLQIDSTFDLSDCVVTTISGDIGDFTSRCSGKIRHVLLGFMISSSKNALNHKSFAREIDDFFLQVDPMRKKSIPSLMTDGEESFKYYSKMKYLEDTQVLRCLVHRRNNLTFIQSKKNISQSDLNKIFGRQIGDEVENGIFNVMSSEAMEAEIVKCNFAPALKKWLLDRKEDLFSTHSLRSRLMAGLLLNYASTNRIENLNSRIKIAIPRKLNGRTCLDKLLEFIEDEKKEFCKSILTGKSELIRYANFKKTGILSAQSQVKALQKHGFRTFSLSHVFEMPKTVWRSVPKQMKIGEVFNKNVIYHKSGQYLVEKDDKSFFVVKTTETNIECKDPKCASKPAITCSHVFAVLSTLPTKKCQEVLNIREKFLISLSRSLQIKSINDGKDAKRYPNRKYSKRSHNNGGRTVSEFKKVNRNVSGESESGDDERKADGNISSDEENDSDCDVNSLNSKPNVFDESGDIVEDEINCNSNDEHVNLVLDPSVDHLNSHDSCMDLSDDPRKYDSDSDEENDIFGYQNVNPVPKPSNRVSNDHSSQIDLRDVLGEKVLEKA